jgi:hypothetical protein
MALCDHCIGDVLYGPFVERRRMERLSLTDPFSQAIAAELKGRSGR